MNVDVWVHRSLARVSQVFCFSLKSSQNVWEGPCWEGIWPILDPLDVVDVDDSQRLECPEELWAVGCVLLFHY